MVALESNENSVNIKHLDNLRNHRFPLGRNDYSVSNIKKMLDNCESMTDVILVRKDILAYRKRMVIQSNDKRNTKERREFYARCTDKATDALDVIKKYDFSNFKLQPKVEESFIGLL